MRLWKRPRLRYSPSLHYLSLSELTQNLDTLTVANNKTEISLFLKKVVLDPKELQKYLLFDEQSYVRRFIKWNPHKYALHLLCWAGYQKTPLHDHNESSCYLKLLSGEMEEVIYKENPCDEVISRHVLNSKISVSYMDNSVGIHTLQNLLKSPSVTLHIYVPPIHGCHVYSPDTEEIERVSFVSSLSPRINPVERKEDSLSLDELVEILRHTKEVDKVREWVDNLIFTDESWTRFCSPLQFDDRTVTRNLIYADDNWSIIINCFSPFQKLPEHGYPENQKAWMKVVLGDLIFVTETSEVGLSATSPTFVEDTLSHHVVNRSPDSCAVSVHVFSPPYIDLEYKTEDGVGVIPPVSQFFSNTINLRRMLDILEKGKIPLSSLLNEAEIQELEKSPGLIEKTSTIECRSFILQKGSFEMPKNSILYLSRGCFTGKKCVSEGILTETRYSVDKESFVILFTRAGGFL